MQAASTTRLNEDGFRVIAVAYKEIDAPKPALFASTDEADLTLLGYIAFLDPPKDSAAAAIAALRAHGVAVKVLTGDNDIVTRKVCREVGLPVDKIVLLGREIEALSDERAGRRASRRRRCSRKLTPQQKARVIQRAARATATWSASWATASTTARR